MTPPTPMPILTPMINSNPSYSDPPLAKSPVEIVENSPAYYQSIRNKKRIEVLEQFNNQGMILLRKESKWNHPKTMAFQNKLTLPNKRTTLEKVTNIGKPTLSN